MVLVSWLQECVNLASYPGPSGWEGPGYEASVNCVCVCVVCVVCVCTWRECSSLTSFSYSSISGLALACSTCISSSMSANMLSLEDKRDRSK